MPLKDNKSWADPISNRIQIKIQKMYLRVTRRKTKGKERRDLVAFYRLFLLFLLWLLCLGELPTINVSTRSKYFGLSD